MGYYFTKHHTPHHHREILTTYIYMTNALLKIDHMLVQRIANSVLTPNHTVELTPKHKAVKGCANVVRTYGHANLKTVT